MRTSLQITLAMLALFVVGCGPEKLETGYQPHALNSSPTMRRSYYASPFSPEAMAPAMSQDAEIAARRPRPGY